jgi:hypothetical protein
MGLHVEMFKSLIQGGRRFARRPWPIHRGSVWKLVNPATRVLLYPMYSFPNVVTWLPRFLAAPSEGFREGRKVSSKLLSYACIVWKPGHQVTNVEPESVPLFRRIEIFPKPFYVFFLQTLRQGSWGASLYLRKVLEKGGRGTQADALVDVWIGHGRLVATL